MLTYKSFFLSILKPLTYINLLGMTLSFIWLVIVSQWGVAWVGFVALMFSPYLIPIALIPAGIFSNLMVLAQAKEDIRKEKAMFLVSLSYVALFLGLWSVGIFYYITSKITADNLSLALYWSVFTAMAPLFLWVSRDKNNSFMIATVFSAEISLIALSVLKLFYGDIGFFVCLSFFLSLLGFLIVLQWFFAKNAVD